MHPMFSRASGLTEQIIAAAIEVHRDKGPDLNEAIYEWGYCRELELQKLPDVSQQSVKITDQGFSKEEPLRLDLLVNNGVWVEAKAVEKILPIHKAQLRNYLKLLDVPIGLLINFNEIKRGDGISRLILSGANR